jgi:hypothetical protein
MLAFLQFRATYEDTHTRVCMWPYAHRHARMYKEQGQDTSSLQRIQRFPTHSGVGKQRTTIVRPTRTHARTHAHTHTHTHTRIVCKHQVTVVPPALCSAGARRGVVPRQFADSNGQLRQDDQAVVPHHHVAAQSLAGPFELGPIRQVRAPHAQRTRHKSSVAGSKTFDASQRSRSWHSTFLLVHRCTCIYIYIYTFTHHLPPHTYNTYR